MDLKEGDTIASVAVVRQGSLSGGGEEAEGESLPPGVEYDEEPAEIQPGVNGDAG
jgi:hypothetical protein